MFYQLQPMQMSYMYLLQMAALSNRAKEAELKLAKAQEQITELKTQIEVCFVV